MGNKNQNKERKRKTNSNNKTKTVDDSTMMIDKDDNKMASSPQITINTNINNTKEKEINLYSALDKGPFFVILNKENISLIHVAKALNFNHIKNIENISKTGKNTVKVIFKNFHDANACVNSKSLQEFDEYSAYIPKICTTSFGIIKDIPTDLPLDEIKANIKSNIPFTNIERLTKWDPKKETAIELNIIKIAFKSGNIPYNVSLYNNILLKVYNFISSPFYCKKCQNYGHTASRCRSEVIRCSICSKISEENHECDLKDACKFCGIGHKTNFFNCKERQRQIQIKKHMITQKTSFWEAKNYLFGTKNIAPKSSDFNVDISNKSAHNKNMTDEKIKILNNLITSLKKELKDKDLIIKKIEDFISKTENANNPALADLLNIKMSDVVKNAA